MRTGRHAVLALLAVVCLAGTAACARDDGGDDGTTTTAAGPEGTTGEGTTTVPGDEATGLDAGGFGDLTDVCSPGDGSALDASDVGVTADSVQIGTFTDKGFPDRQGLNEEMYDAAVAFANWCNEHGGINGREVVISDRDAAIGAYNDQIVAACSEDFAVVGGGAVLDDSDGGGRVECGLPSIPGYVVSAAAREADLQVQPLPNPLTSLSAGPYRRIAEEFPELLDRFGVMTSNFGSVRLVRDTVVDAVEQLGYTVVYNQEYNTTGEPDWRPFAEQLRTNDVQVLEFVGEPDNFSQLLAAMDLVGYRPQVIIQQANFYERRLLELAGDDAEDVLVRLQFTPLELADTNPATSDYLELMERYNPDGKVALLGMQATSALLLFAQAATACGAELTRTCLLEQASSITEWTGGGLHAVQDPSSDQPSPCFALMRIEDGAYVLDEELTQADEGIYNCDPANVLEVEVPTAG